MSKFKPGDLVWAKDTGLQPAPEVPGVVAINLGRTCSTCGEGEMYGVEVPGDKWGCCTSLLRPRRDDYQQHEPKADANLKELIEIVKFIGREGIKQTEPA